MKTHLIFDLDGTLIDSAPGILKSLAEAFAVCGYVPRRALNADVIGPPLMETIADLSGTNESASHLALANAFKAIYDREGYRASTAFFGVNDMLANLYANNIKLYIATNKRISPARMIIDYFGWTFYFSGIYALDSFEPPLKSKADVLAAILKKYAINRQNVLYIGDRQEDEDAASFNHIAFAQAMWGYDTPTNLAPRKLSSPHQLVEEFHGFKYVM